MARPLRLWLGRGAIATWLLLGVVAALVAPEEPPLPPDIAERMHGEARSSESSAPGGLMALRFLLKRLGFEVEQQRHTSVPLADLLILLAPQSQLSEPEVDVLVDWLAGGGRLIYAAATVALDSEKPDTEEQSAPSDPTDDDVIEALTEDDLLPSTVERLAVLAGRHGSANVWHLGRGTVALIDAGGACLTNAGLAEAGLVGEYGWLMPLLDGVERVAFDEGRTGLARGPEGLFALLGRSRLRAASQLGLLALLLWLLARALRRAPAHDAAPAGGRAFGEHLDALGTLLHTGTRTRLARQALLGGSRRRLGPLVAQPVARALLDEVETTLTGRASASAMTRGAERLRRLEAELLGPRS